MEVYLIMSFIPLLFAGIYPKLNMNSHQKKQFCWIVGIILILFLGLRSKYIGSTDTYNYYNMMTKAISAIEWRDYYNPKGVETGFQLFVWLLSRIFHDPQWIIVISSIINISSVLIFICRNSKNIPLSLTMYVSLGLMQFQMQGMRQAIAMSICLFAYEFAKNKKTIPFLLLVFLAMQFHRTAIVFIAVYFLGKLKIKATHILLFSAGALVALFSIDKIIETANELFDRGYRGTVDSGGFIATSIYILIIVFALLISKKPYDEHMNSTTFYMLLLGFNCFIVRYIGALAAERISFYFVYSQIIILPNTIVEGNLTGRDVRIVNLVVYILSIALFMYRLYGSDFVPFHFFWG